jgi:hypothetical protein
MNEWVALDHLQNLVDTECSVIPVHMYTILGGQALIANAAIRPQWINNKLSQASPTKLRL